MGSPEPKTYPKKRGEAGREFSKISGRRLKAAPPMPLRGISPEKSCSTGVPLMFSG
jgi:hypothetical protein